jgi:chromosomal replication initiation ATPase DnaA
MQLPETDPFAIASRLRTRGLYRYVSDVCLEHGVTVREVLSSTHRRAPTRCRHHIWHGIRTDPALHYSYPDLGRIFNRDHSTILQGVRKHEQRVQGVA